MENGKKIGVIYTAIGTKYVNEAICSVTSLKENNPDLKATLFTDKKQESEHFDKVVIINNPKKNFRDRIVAMIDSSYDYCLCLDTDTYICNDIYHVFDLLCNYDFAAAHAPIHIAPVIEGVHSGYEVEGIPDAFPEVNGGVILFRKNEKMKKLLYMWLAYYDEVIMKTNETKSDQPVLRKALYESEIKMTILPPEYNCRFNMITTVYGEVKILHGRSENFKKIKKTINSSHNLRVYIDGYGIITQNSLLTKIFNKISK